MSSSIATAPTGTRRWLILDRDGVINHDSDAYIRSPDDWQPIDGALDAVARLHRAGFGLAVATNQSGIGRGYFNLATLDAIHAKMRAAIEAAGGQLAAVAYCPHDPDAGCDCRKPAPGLLLAAARQLGIDAERLLMVGDSAPDMQSAHAAGCRAVLVPWGYGHHTLPAWLDPLRVAGPDELLQVLLATRSTTESFLNS